MRLNLRLTSFKLRILTTTGEETRQPMCRSLNVRRQLLAAATFHKRWKIRHACVGAWMWELSFKFRSLFTTGGKIQHPMCRSLKVSHISASSCGPFLPKVKCFFNLCVGSWLWDLSPSSSAPFYHCWRTSACNVYDLECKCDVRLKLQSRFATGGKIQHAMCRSLNVSENSARSSSRFLKQVKIFFQPVWRSLNLRVISFKLRPLSATGEEPVQPICMILNVRFQLQAPATSYHRWKASASNVLKLECETSNSSSGHFLPQMEWFSTQCVGAWM
jgi:hypothetical protein